MKVLMVADARSIHTRRWAVSLSHRGVDVVLFSLYPTTDCFFENHIIPYYEYDLFRYKKLNGIRRLNGLIVMHCDAVRRLRKIITDEHPDIVHAHYATSIGLVAALSCFHPFLISVWGSDVYEFPFQSLVNRFSLKYIFRKADRILSTSNVMSRQVSRFTSKKVLITPFGVDTELFRQLSSTDCDRGFVVGNVKTLSPKYGIDVLIRAFKIVHDSNPGISTRLVIVGDGPCREEYEQLAVSLEIGDSVSFAGCIDNSILPRFYNSFSVAVSLSRQESFGVVAVESMSCGCPVVVSDADGFKEVVQDGVTGFVVRRDDPQAAAAAIQRFIDNPSLRTIMGTSGRARVKSMYDWNDNVSTMLDIYRDVLRFFA